MAKMAERRFMRVFLLLPLLLSLFFGLSEGKTNAEAKKEKTSHFRLYFHDNVTGKNQSVVRSAPPAEGFLNNFGSIMVIDDALTAGPASDSARIGSAQGIYVSAAKEELRYLMVMNFIFQSGEYNGSTLALLGSNPILDGTREMPVIGGTGLFRFARGFAEARTYFRNPKTRNAIVRYDITVLHF